MITSPTWRVHSVDHEGVVFKAPNGKYHSATCVSGRFDYEGQWGFFEAMKPGTDLVGCVKRYRPQDGRHFTLHHPETSRLGSSVNGDEYRLFEIVTPSGFKLVMRFENGPAPLELKGFIEKLFGTTASQTAKEIHHGPRQQRPQPVPASPRHREGQGLDQPEGLQGSPKRRGQRKASGRRQAHRQHDQAVKIDPDKKALAQKFLNRLPSRPAVASTS